MRTRIGQEESLTLKTITERRCECTLSDHRHVMQAVMKAKRITNDDERCANVYLCITGYKVVNSKCSVKKTVW